MLARHSTPIPAAPIIDFDKIAEESGMDIVKINGELDKLLKLGNAGPHSNHVEHTLKRIHNGYTMPLSLSELATEVFLSKSYLCNCFAHEIGTPVGEYIIRLRIAKAKQLLLENKLTLIEITRTCGYKDESYFVRMFRKKVGATPDKWRRRILSEAYVSQRVVA